MYLMRIGPAGSERPIVRIDETHYLDVSDVLGNFDEAFRIPRGSTKLDWEVELGVVISKRTSYLDSVDDAHGAIAGYVVVNDVSERVPDRAGWTVVKGQVGRDLQSSRAMARHARRNR
jgi:2-keto-4-pentenoate hydratase/2-oxohepta-3-ene-1,7-dioic acid hydratase in catechol pathway